jgi:hypothetical protein
MRHAGCGRSAIKFFGFKRYNKTQNLLVQERQILTFLSNGRTQDNWTNDRTQAVTT